MRLKGTLWFAWSVVYSAANPAASQTPYRVVVIGNLWELKWIEHVFSAVPPAVIPPPPWQAYQPEDPQLLFALTSNLQLSVNLEDGSSGGGGSDAAERGDPPVLLVTNVLSNEAVRDLAFRLALADPRTSLAVVDEHGDLSDTDCFAFQFVVRVGFGFPHHHLWQPANTVVVPLGPPSTFPDLGGAFDDRPVSRRSFAAAFAGRTQNKNRHLMLAALGRLPGRAAVRSMGNATWAEAYHGSCAQPLGAAPVAWSPFEHAAALADSALAPSPPGNVHPECYRTYEALEAGALPVVRSASARCCSPRAGPLDCPCAVRRIVALASALGDAQTHNHKTPPSFARRLPCVTRVLRTG